MVSFRSPVIRDAPAMVFAVDATSIQISYRGPFGDLVVTGAGVEHRAAAPDGAVVTSLRGLQPNTEYELTLSCGSWKGELSARTRNDIGEVGFRFATISDLHIGADYFGHFPATPDPAKTDSGATPYAYRCAVAAIEEAVAWGAELLIIKGDLTEYGMVAHWEAVGRLLGGVTIPILATPGNHDTWKTAELEAQDGLARAGLHYDPVQIVDRPGVRIVIGDTSIKSKGTGSLQQIRKGLVSSVAETTDPVFVGIHHNIQRSPVTWFWPPGISSTNARSVVADIAKANPNVFISSGHTHRNRRHNLGPNGQIVYTEVSSTSDYPGAWAAYEVSESTIRQTVRRIASPSAVGWTEETRQAVKGGWHWWSPGTLNDRCVDLSLQ